MAANTGLRIFELRDRERRRRRVVAARREGEQQRNRVTTHRRNLTQRYPLAVSRYVVVLVVACIGCSTKHAAPHKTDCENAARIDALAGGFVKHGAAGRFDFKLIAMTPSAPARGDNKWLIEVDAAGTAVVRADVGATPFMPDHGHGTPVKVGVTPSATPGQYELAPVNLWMPGYWQIAVTAASGNDRDSAVFELCIAS
jgi:hypothetical protein